MVFHELKTDSQRFSNKFFYFHEVLILIWEEFINGAIKAEDSKQFEIFCIKFCLKGSSNFVDQL